MNPAAHRVGLADILRRHESAYLATHDLSAAKARVWRAIVACRIRFRTSLFHGS